MLALGRCSACGRELAPPAARCVVCGPDSHDALVGCVLADRYRVTGFVGAGEMGRVYRAEHVTLERTVAVRVLSGAYARSGPVLERFRREAIATSRLAHPNVVGALDFGVADGLAFFVMEWLPGVALEGLIASGRGMAPARALRLAYQAACGLGAAHAQGLVHRDVRPRKLVVLSGDLLKVVDFGLAQLRETTRHEALAEPSRRDDPYLAPEVAGDGAVGPAADVYALGVVLREMLTGRHAGAVTAPSLASAVRRWPALGDTELDPLLDAMLADDPRERPRDGGVAAGLIAAASARLTGAPLAGALRQARRSVLIVADLGEDSDDARRHVAATVADVDGVLARAVGDEVFAHFPSAELAVLAAIAISERRTAAPRIVVHEGEVQLGAGGGLFGATVNHALRIARLAPPGAIVVTAPAAAAAGPAVGALLSPNGEVVIGAGAKPMTLSVVRARAAQDPAIAATVGAGFRCSCGAPEPLTGARTRWTVVRCVQCTAPWIVRPGDPGPTCDLARNGGTAAGTEGLAYPTGAR